LPKGSRPGLRAAWICGQRRSDTQDIRPIAEIITDLLSNLDVKGICSMKRLLVLAMVTTPAFADVYRCNVGNKTIYQDQPCPNAKVIDNINALPPSRQEQIKAMDRIARERAIVEQRVKAREAEAAKSAQSKQTVSSTTVTTTTYPSKKDYSRPDKYYDRPDRYYDRSETRYTGSGPR
jgi:hypothetical protein